MGESFSRIGRRKAAAGPLDPRGDGCEGSGGGAAATREQRDAAEGEQRGGGRLGHDGDAADARTGELGQQAAAGRGVDRENAVGAVRDVQAAGEELQIVELEAVCTDPSGSRKPASSKSTRTEAVKLLSRLTRPTKSPVSSVKYRLLVAESTTIEVGFAFDPSVRARTSKMDAALLPSRLAL